MYEQIWSLQTDKHEIVHLLDRTSHNKTYKYISLGKGTQFMYVCMWEFNTDIDRHIRLLLNKLKIISENKIIEYSYHEIHWHCISLIIKLE